MTKKTALMIVAIIAFVTVIVVGVSFAWFVYFRNSMIVITGDADISVVGWCDSVAKMDDRVFSDDNKMVAGKSNTFGEGEDDKKLAASQFVTYKFQITNNSARPAMLSLRISNMFDYIFTGLKNYVEEAKAAKAAGQPEPTLDFSDIANENNGRLAFLFNYIYYEREYPYGVIKSPSGKNINPDDGLKYINDPDEDMYIWKYSRDQRIIGNNGNIDADGIDKDLYFDENLHQILNKIILPPYDTVKKEAPYKINLYLSLTNKQSTTTNDEYRKWFAGETVEGVRAYGAAQEYAANKFYASKFSTLDADTAHFIDKYVTEFVEEEIGSIITEDEVLLNLNLKYFEFIGENASDDDINELERLLEESETETGTEPEPEPEPEP